jgi:hypothetical protein
MAAVLHLDTATAPSLDQADAGVAMALAHVATLPTSRACRLIATYRAQLDAAEAVALAAVVSADGSTRAAERSMADTKTSKRTRRRVAKRAQAVKKNAQLASKMSSGQLSGEHVDALAKAATRTQGASLTDDALIDTVANSNPDLADSIIDDYLLKNGTSDQAQSRHDRQRAGRRVSRFRTKDDCEAIMIAGDKATIDRIWDKVTRRSQAFYQADGGRDLPLGQHPRTHDQRMFDAAAEALLGQTPQPSDDAPDSAPSAAASSDDGARPSRRCTPKSARSAKPRVTSERPTIVVAMTLQKYLGLDITTAAEMIGTGPIADSVLAELAAADPEIVGAIFGTDGQPLWLGRQVRLASKAQLMALILRDKHCVLCGADHARCRAHHTMPWSAPGKGKTNIDELVLVCDSCHNMVHDTKQTMYRDRTSGNWRLRPALPHEIPSSRPGRGETPQRI